MGSSQSQLGPGIVAELCGADCAVGCCESGCAGFEDEALCLRGVFEGAGKVRNAGNFAAAVGDAKRKIGGAIVRLPTRDKARDAVIMVVVVQHSSRSVFMKSVKASSSGSEVRVLRNHVSRQSLVTIIAEFRLSDDEPGSMRT